jgi:phosphoribosylformylglycinamidine (FGAM) synthase-like amidotransferase family enzyme
VTITDLAAGKVQLGGFRGLAMCGGFSYADVLDSAKVRACLAGLDESAHAPMAMVVCACACACTCALPAELVPKFDFG